MTISRLCRKAGAFLALAMIPAALSAAVNQTAINGMIRRLTLEEAEVACARQGYPPLPKGWLDPYVSTACKRVQAAKAWEAQPSAEQKGMTNGKELETMDHLARNSAEMAQEAIAAGRIRESQRKDYSEYLMMRALSIINKRDAYSKQGLTPYE